MSDNRDGNSGRGGGGSPPRSGRPRSEDPLAELARLIDEDPFADFDRTREVGAEPDASAGAGEWTIDTSWPRYDPSAENVDGGENDQPQRRMASSSEEAGGVAHQGPDHDQAEVERFQQSLEDHFRQIEAQGASGAERGAEEHASHRQASAFDEPEVPPAPDMEEPWQAPASANAPYGSFDPVSAVAAHLFADEPRHDDAPAGEPGGADPRRNPFTLRPPQAHEIVRSASAAPDDRSPAAEPPPLPGELPDHAAYADLDPDVGDWPDEHGRDIPYAEPHYEEGYGPSDYQGHYFDEPVHPASHEPAYGADANLAPPPFEVMERRPRRGLVVVSSLVGLVVLGGAVALGYRGLSSDPSGDPPVIRADAAPTKVVSDAEETAGEEGQGKLVYERIGGTETERQERLVSREEPVFEVEGRDGPAEAADRPGTSDPRAASQEVPARDRTEPRRVRTVVVRPDGTIIPPSEPARREETAAAETGEAQDVPSSGQTESEADAGPLPEETVALATPEEPAFVPPSAPQPEQAVPDQAVPEQAVPDQAVFDQSEDDPGIESGQPRQAEAPQQTQAGPSGDQRSGRPLQLVPSRGAAGAAAASEQTQTAAVPSAPEEQEAPSASQPFPSGSYVVQVSSTRSEQEARAAASSLAQRHGSLLGDYRMGVERADLGDRGVFYRVAAGAMPSQSDATALCEEFKANGLDCFVRRN